MKKVLIDINIILDMIGKREDHLSAAQLFDLVTKRKIKGYLSSHEVTTLSYLLGRYKYSKEKRDKIVSILLDTFSVIPINEKILRTALYSGIDDYEDAVIEVSAQSVKADFIVTGNLKDFEKGTVPCCNSGEALVLIQH